MSDFPSTYGMYGAQDHSQAPSYLPPQPYPQYGMQSQPDGGRIGQAQAHAHNMSSSYDASGYGYNGPPAPVPAPSFSASTLASGVPPLPIFQGWNQDSMPLPPFNPNNNPQYMGYADTNAQNAHHNSQYYVGQPSQPSYQPTHQSMPQASQPYDEGEVSESEFRANSHQMNNHAAAAAAAPHGANQYDRNDYGEPNSTYNGNAVQAAPRAYQPANGYNAPRDSPQSRVPPSDAYSPYASPKVPEYPGQQAKGNNHHPRANNYARGRGNDGFPNKTGGRKNTGSKVSDTASSANAAGTPTSADTAKQPSSLPPPPAASAQVPSATVSKPLAEARKKAESAVLNLLPYGIRYQNYVDEGFKAELVGSIFDDLRQPRGPPKATGEGTSNGSQMGSQQPSLQSANAKNGTTNVAGLPKLATFQTTSAAPTTAVMTEKERTLQSKMEALRKSREERAQKAAAKSTAKSPTDATSPALPAPIQSQPSAVAPPAKVPISEPEPAPPSLPARPNVAIPSQSPKQPVKPPQTPAIPGLFLTSTSTAPSPAPPAIPTPSTLITVVPPPINHRKRPVAADFEQPTLVSTFKRPFGHSRNEQPLVIDVSEDELDSDDEDVEMDLESQADQDSPSQPVRKLSENRAGTFSNLPGLSDFSRKPFSSPPSSATSTPLVSQNGTKFNPGRPEVLQRKESEIEQLKKKIAEAEAKRKARQTPTGGQTPRDPSTQSVDGKESNGIDIASKVEASMKMQQLIGVVDDKVHSDQQKLVATHVAEAANEAELKKQEEERKRLRLQRIASDLPLVDAQVQQSQTKLEQLRAEMARLEEEVEKNLEAKRQMAEEMERLGRETEQQLQEQREKLQDLTREDIATNIENGSSSNVPGPATNENRPQQSTEQSAESHDEVMADVPEPEQPVASTSATQQLVPKAAEAEKTAQQSANPTQQVSTDQALEAALQEAVRAEADYHADTEMDISFAPDPNQLAPESCSNPAEGEIHSPEYTPVLESTVVEDMDGESDIYEPPEATPPVDMPSPIESPPFSPAPPEVIEPRVVDEPMQVSDQIKPQDVQDVVLRDQPSRAVISPVLSNVDEKPESTQLFTPYQSPLRYFRAFRFHPTYKQEVAGGLRSLTFSNKIDPSKEFCKFELAGGICNDATCEFQHFKEIGLPDDAVLTTLGSPDQFNDEQREKFCEGLRGVLTDLRARKIKDFDVIASEIIAHRSKFLGDNSKILNLEDTTI